MKLLLFSSLYLFLASLSFANVRMTSYCKVLLYSENTDEIERVTETLSSPFIETAQHFPSYYDLRKRFYLGPRGLVLNVDAGEYLVNRGVEYGRLGTSKLSHYELPQEYPGRIKQPVFHPSGNVLFLLLAPKPFFGDAQSKHDTGLVVMGNPDASLESQNSESFYYVPERNAKFIAVDPTGEELWILDSFGAVRLFSAGALIEQRQLVRVPLQRVVSLAVGAKQVRSIVALGKRTIAVQGGPFLYLDAPHFSSVLDLELLRRQSHSIGLGDIIAGSYLSSDPDSRVISLTFSSAGTFVMQRDRNKDFWEVHSWFGRPYKIESKNFGRAVHAVDHLILRSLSENVRTEYLASGSLKKVRLIEPVHSVILAKGTFDDELSWTVDASGAFRIYSSGSNDHSGEIVIDGGGEGEHFFSATLEGTKLLLRHLSGTVVPVDIEGLRDQIAIAPPVSDYSDSQDH